VLASAGASLSDVVKAIVFLFDIYDYAPANKIYSAEFDGHRPARAAVTGIAPGGGRRSLRSRSC